MTANAIARASAALLFCMAALVSGHALAQNYPGAGLLRFGAFGQLSVTDFDLGRSVDDNGSASDTSFGGGASLGYDLLFHNGLVIGIEADAAFDTLQTDHALREFRVDYLSTIRGRFGSYVRPDLLFYGTVGVSFLGVGYEGLRDEVTGLRFREDQTLVGWTAGLGTEFDWHGIVFFGEYLFAGYDAFSFTETIDLLDEETQLVATKSLRHDIDVDQHVFRLGVKFIIGHDYRVEEAYLPLK